MSARSRNTRSVLKSVVPCTTDIDTPSPMPLTRPIAEADTDLPIVRWNLALARIHARLQGLNARSEHRIKTVLRPSPLSQFVHTQRIHPSKASSASPSASPSPSFSPSCSPSSSSHLSIASPLPSPASPRLNGRRPGSPETYAQSPARRRCRSAPPRLRPCRTTPAQA